MATTGIKAMEIMATMVTVIKAMEDMVAMITLVTTTIMAMVTTTVSIVLRPVFFLLLKQYKRVKFSLCSHVQINLVVMASRHDVVVTRTVTSRINRGNPPLEIGM